MVDVEKRVGVFGATSMVGKCLLPLMMQAGWQVMAYSRRVDRQMADGIEWRQITSAVSVRRPAAGQGIKLWVSLAPITVLPDYFDLMEAHGARRVVALSSTSRFSKTDSSDAAERELAARLAAAEEALQRWAETRKIEWVILRPTLIYGLGLDKNVGVIAGFIRRFGFFPVLGAARGLRQPVHAADVAHACCAALVKLQAVNQSYNISGAETLTYRDMVGRVFAAMGRRPRFLTVPLVLFRLAVTCLRVLPRYRKWSPAMAERMNCDLEYDHAAAMRDLDFAPRRFSPQLDDLLPGSH